VSSPIAVLAGLGGYYLCTAAILIALLPFQFSLPMFGTMFYEPLITILAIVTTVGAAIAGAIAYGYGGERALAVVALLWLAAAVPTVAPFIAEGSRVWIPPSDIQGLMPAAALTISELVGLPALLAGAFLGSRLVRGRKRLNVLVAAGAYYATGVVLSLPTPQLDLRLTLPFSAGYLPAEWHAVVIVISAIVGGLFLRGQPVWKPAAVGALLGLAAAIPFEIPALTSPIRPYWPVSLVGVPIATAAFVIVGAWIREPLTRASWLRRVLSRPITAAGAGAVGMAFAIGGWIALAEMPNPSDRLGSVEAYQRTGDERKIVACLVTGRGEELRGSSAREDANTVAVTVRLRRPPSWYFSDLVGISLPVVVVLRDPLGGRTVIDQVRGTPVREVAAGTFTGC